MRATLFSKADCGPCRFTAHALTRYGIAFDKIDVEQSPEARQKLLELGYTSVPVVYIDDDHHWQLPSRTVLKTDIKQLTSA